jgi:hypothetical protein
LLVLTVTQLALLNAFNTSSSVISLVSSLSVSPLQQQQLHHHLHHHQQLIDWSLLVRGGWSPTGNARACGLFTFLAFNVAAFENRMHHFSAPGQQYNAD